MKNNSAWKATWWRACADVARDTETKARCMGNAVYEAAMSAGIPTARAEGLDAYLTAGGKTFTAAPVIK